MPFMFNYYTLPRRLS